MAARAKTIENKAIIDLAKQIKSKHALINRVSDELDALKVEINKHAKVEFFSDLKCATDDEGQPIEILSGTPDVYGNFEVPVDNNDKVTINFQTGSKTFGSIDNKPAPDVLRGIFGQEYEKLFDEKSTFEVIASKALRDDQAKDNPSLFLYRIKEGVEPEELQKLYASRPDILECVVADPAKYAKRFPVCVKEEKKVSLKSGFLEKVGKVDTPIRDNAKQFMAGLFGSVLKIVVKCGNANKKK